ncbi:putative lipid II flippase FtsW [Verrucomicrobiota bacterium]
MRRIASILITIVVLLLTLGIVMLASTSSTRATAFHQDPYYFVKRQFLWLLLSVAVGAVLVRFDYHHWRKGAIPVAATALGLLVAVLIPGIGQRIGGSRRWIRVAGLSFQPSEFAKIAVVMALSCWLAHIGPGTRRLFRGLILPVAGIGLAAGLLIMEPDFGTTLLVGAVGMTILFVAGVRIGYLAVTAAVGAGVFVIAVLRDPVRLARVLGFLMPGRYPATSYHLDQSKRAFMQGGFGGVGLGQSIQKEWYLPEAHTDFILAIVGEELGFLFTLAVVLLFFGLLVCGMVISLRAPDLFGQLLGFGITVMIVLQAAINTGVVTGCLPTKGLPLPFISYGGSSLLASMAGICILLNVARHGTSEYVDPHTRPIKDVVHSG